MAKKSAPRNRVSSAIKLPKTFGTMTHLDPMPPLRKRHSVKQLLATKSQIVVDVGGGENPTPNSINIDIRDLPTTDIVHDIEVYPWPLPDGCVDLLIARTLSSTSTPRGATF